MSEEKQMCIFGDEYGECPVMPRLEEMMRELVSTIKAIKVSDKEDFDAAMKPMMNTLSTVMSAPPQTLSQFCQACPKIKRRYE